MKRLSVLLLMIPVAASALTVPPKVHRWQDAESSLGPRPNLPMDREAAVVMIESLTTHIHYLFEPQQALILSLGSFRYFYWAYNDGYSHVRTQIFSEYQLDDPGSWILKDIYEWTGDGSLRYVSPSAYWDGAFWYPQVTFSAAPPHTCWYMIDEGSGCSIWSNPYDLLISCDNPVTWTGPNNIVYLLGTSTTAAGYLFVVFDGWSANVLNQVPVLQSAYGVGYENSQLIYHQRSNKIVVAAGGYRTDDIGAPDNPLLVMYQESTDGGETWSEEVWLDQETVPDMPGSLPGMEGHYSNSFFDLLMDGDGDLHVAAVIADSGYYGNQSEILGLYDIHQDQGVWTASLICDGTYIYENEFWDPGDLYTDGDSWMHSPSLAIHPDGPIFSAWNDLGNHDDGDTTASVDIWASVSTDEGSTWFEPVLVTDTVNEDEYFSRLMYQTTDEFVYFVTMYGAGGIDGPLYCIQWWPQPDIGVAETPVLDARSLTVVGPNPSGDSIVLLLTLPTSLSVDANVYDIRGELVQPLRNGMMRAGTHELVFDGQDVPAGIYFCKVEAGSESMWRKMVLVR